jgi:hypothetical protein
VIRQPERQPGKDIKLGLYSKAHLRSGKTELQMICVNVEQDIFGSHHTANALLAAAVIQFVWLFIFPIKNTCYYYYRQFCKK